MSKELELIEQFKKDHVKTIAENLARNGGLPPLVAIFGKTIPGIESMLKNEDYGVFIIPIPEEFLKNSDTKSALSQIIPDIFNKLEEKGVEPLCYSWSSEAWMHQTDVENSNIEDVKKNWKGLPKVEILMTTFETKDTNEVVIDKIIRNGKMSDEDGKLIDCISLERHDAEGFKNGNMEGNLSNLFQKYLKAKREKNESNA
jgi:hypothetical protein